MNNETDFCLACKKFLTTQCSERKQSGTNPSPFDWCAAFKEKTDKGGKKDE